jgi:type IV pilus assembly protein PilA
MFCPQCGTNNPDASQFCAKCGKALRASAVPGAAYPASPSYVGPAETSGKALASLICGILFFIFPAAVAAIILGHLSLSDIRRAAGRLTGRGMATAGLVLGYMGLAFIPFILIIAAIAIPNLLRARLAANEAGAVGCLRTIVTANSAYAADYSNGFAESLQGLGGEDAGSADCNHPQLVSRPLEDGLMHGYRFIYTPKPSAGGQSPAISPQAAAKGCTVPGVHGFTVLALPVVPGNTGIRSFFVDETGVIRWDKGAATEDSPALQ